MTTAALHVVFVCTANICRSPYAHLRTLQLAGAQLAVSSAGTHGFTSFPMDEDMAEQLVARGGDPTHFSSRRLTAEILATADLVLAAGVVHRSFILDEWPGAMRKVFTLGQFADTIERVPSGLTAADVVSQAFLHRGLASRTGDVPDPYRRGPGVAAAVAEHVDELLARILPRLVPDSDSSGHLAPRPLP